MSMAARTDETERMEHLSPRARARLTGVVYLLFFLTAILGAVVAPGISGLGGVATDASGTAHAILAHEAAYRLGWALGMISIVCYVAVVCLFYQLFRPVSRSVALLAAFFGLVAQSVTAVGSLFQIAPLVVLGGSSYLRAFSAQQVQELALLLLNLGVQVGDIALVFAGPFQLLIGYLIFRSTYLPRMLGVLVALAGVGWLLFLWPPLANSLLTYLEILGILGELPLMLWLLVIGVNAQRWQDQASRAAASRGN